MEFPSKLKELTLENPTLSELKKLKSEAETNHSFTLVRITYPHKILDTWTGSLASISHVSPFATKESDTLRVAVHVRRGELYVVDSNRMLPNGYYIAAMLKMAEVFDELKVRYRFELYTEMPASVFR